MKSRLPIVTIIVLSSAAACNETVGDCWPVGQDPGSGGVIDPGGSGAGAGTSGDEPTGQAQQALGMDQCNATDQSNGDPYEAALKVLCTESELGPPCEAMCRAKKLWCAAYADHPQKKAAGGVGKLFSCNTLVPGWMCGYSYPDGDNCFYTFMNPFPATCVYLGGK
jgi:hypothetical protein